MESKVYEHRLGQLEAYNRIKDLVDQTLKDSKIPVTDMVQNWHEFICIFSFRVKGFLVSGIMKIEPNLVKLELNLPWIAIMYRQKIMDALDKKAEEILKTEDFLAKSAKNSQGSQRKKLKFI